MVSGNYVTSKRRGVVDGVDFGSTGSVRFVQHEAIHQQLDLGHLVLLSNLGYSASGEVLNCNTFDVATHAAIELKADKIMCITMDDVKSLNMPQWLSLGDAEALISERLAGVGSDIACSIDETCPSLDGTAVGAINSATPPLYSSSSNGSRPPDQAYLNNGNSNGAMGSVRHQTLAEVELDMDCWQALNFPNAILTAVVGCKSGVKRAHLVDARQDGGLLLELYSRCAHHSCILMPSCLPLVKLSCLTAEDAAIETLLFCISPSACTTSSMDAVHIQMDTLSSVALVQTSFTTGSSHTWRSMSTCALVVHLKNSCGFAGMVWAP